MRLISSMVVVILALSFQAQTAAAQAQNAATPQELIAQAKAIESKDPKTALELLGRALPGLQEPKDAALNREVHAYRCILTAVFDPGAALPLVEEGLQLARAVSDTKAESRLLLCEGKANEKLQNMDAASTAYTAALLVAEKAEDLELLSESNLRPLINFHEMRARNYSRLGDFQKAYEAGNELLAVQRKLDKRVLEDQLAKFGRERAELEERILLVQKEKIQEAEQSQKTQFSLRWQIIILGSVLLALLLILTSWQYYKKRRIRILSMTDELTKLPNRQHILTFLGDQAKNAYEEEQPLSVIAFEIDNFMQIKDKNGLDGGELVIKTIADISSQALRRGDRVGRVGDREFLVVLPGSPRKPAVDVAERLRRSIEVTEIDKLPHAMEVTISLGVCEWNVGHESIDGLMKRTHNALEEAKKEGCNRVMER